MGRTTACLLRQYRIDRYGESNSSQLSGFGWVGVSEAGDVAEGTGWVLRVVSVRALQWERAGGVGFLRDEVGDGIYSRSEERYRLCRNKKLDSLITV